MEEKKANRWMEERRMGLLRECDRDSETMGVRETDGERKRERNRKRSTRGSEEERRPAWSAAGTRTVGGEEGKREAREGGGMLRSRGNRLPSVRFVPSLSRFCRVGCACRLSLSRTPPVSHRSLLSPIRSSIGIEDLSDSSSHPSPPLSLSLSHSLSRSIVIPRGRESSGRADAFSLLPSLGILPRSSLSSRGFLLLLLFLLLPRDPSPIVATGARTRTTHVCTHMYVHTDALFSRREPRLFSNARPRFLADFIPIPRNKLAGDHGGICLLDDLYFVPFSGPCSLIFSLSRFLICCSSM